LIWILLDSSQPSFNQIVIALFLKPFDAGNAGVGDLDEFDFMAPIAKGVVSGDQG
jgi:hypothetical protein